MIASSACYFPYTDITPRRLIRAAAFFNRIILFSLPPDQAGGQIDSEIDNFITEAETQGILNRTDASFIQDRSELKRILADFSGWIEQFKDPNYLKLLKGLPLNTPKQEETSSRLMSHIRRGNAPDQPRDPEREAQIFLHIAQRLDRQHSEIDQLMTGVQQKESRLSSLLGVSSPEEQAEVISDDVESPLGSMQDTPIDEPGAEMMAERLVAWGQLYNRFGAQQIPLFTDHPEAIAALDMQLARIYSPPELDAGRTTEVLEPFMTAHFPDPTGSRRTDVKDVFAVRQRYPEINGLIDRVATKSWTLDDISLLRAEVIHSLPARKVEAGGLTLTGYLLPGRDLKEAFLQAVGLSPDTPRTDVFCGPIFSIVRQ